MSFLKIKVLGPGCANCKKLLENVKAAVREMGADAQVEYVTEMDEIRKYIMMTPGIVINEKVAHQGKPLPGVDKVKKLIRKAAGNRRVGGE